MGSPERLDPALVAMIEDPRNTPVFSVASLWEVVIKQALGKPGFQIQPEVLRRGAEPAKPSRAGCCATPAPASRSF